MEGREGEGDVILTPSRGRNEELARKGREVRMHYDGKEGVRDVIVTLLRVLRL